MDRQLQTTLYLLEVGMDYSHATVHVRQILDA